MTTLVEEVKISDVTLNICQQLDIYKKNLRNDMVIGDTKIIIGVEIVEKIVREINPIVYSEEVIRNINFMIKNYLDLKEKNMSIINHYTLYGINMAKNIMESVIYEKIRNNKKLILK